MTRRKAGPSFSRVVMSLKRIPSVGKSLMSRIFARSSATSIAEVSYRQSAVSHNQPHAGATRKTCERSRTRCWDELYLKQSRATDPEERRKYLRAFEKRLYDEEVHYIHTFQWHRIIPHLSKVRGWTVTPSHYVNNQLDTVWLSE